MITIDQVHQSLTYELPQVAYVDIRNYDAPAGFWRDYQDFLRDLLPNDHNAQLNWFLYAVETAHKQGGSLSLNQMRKLYDTLAYMVDKHAPECSLVSARLTGSIDPGKRFAIQGEAVLSVWQDYRELETVRAFGVDLISNRVEFLKHVKTFLEK